MEFKGTISKLLPAESGRRADGSIWESQKFLFEYKENENDRWSDRVMLSMSGEEFRKKELKEGDKVQIGFSHYTREYQGKHYNEIRAYKVEKVENSEKGQKEAPQAANAPKVDNNTPKGKRAADDDDLPF